MLALLLFFISASPASSVELGSFPELFKAEVEGGDIWDELKAGHYKYAIKLTEDLFFQEVKQALNDEKLIPTIVSKLAEELQKILSDATLTEPEKKEAIFGVVTQSLENYSSVSAGELNLMLKHSIEYGATRFVWDKKTEVDTCDGGTFYWSCRNLSCSEGEWAYHSWTDYVYKVPDYYLYRVINGQSTLLTKLKGSRSVTRNTLVIGESAWDSVKSAYNYYNAQNPYDVDSTQAAWVDLNSDYRNIGDALSYKVVADNSPYKLGDCGSSETYTSLAFLDADGDGKVDFIPQSVYDELWMKNNAWFIPVITLLN